MADFRADVISDTHLNLWKYTPEQIGHIFPAIPDVPTLILAGDIGDPDHVSLYTAIQIAKERYKRVIYIPGNHEFYNREPHSKKTPASVLSWFNNLDTQWDNFHFFYRRNELYNGVRVLGATGWSTSPRDTQWSKVISEEGRKDINFLEQGLLHSKQPTLVITHYPSTMRVLQPDFANKLTQYDYAQDLERMYRYPVNTWIFGHVHQKHDFTVPYSSSLYGNGNVRVICNPYGYPNEPIAANKPLKFSISTVAQSPDDRTYRTL
jgi:predicted phosphodiesterase